jgi:hypothetical protein
MVRLKEMNQVFEIDLRDDSQTWVGYEKVCALDKIIPERISRENERRKF